MSSNWITKKLRNKIYNRDNFICCYCGKECVPASKKGMTRAEQVEYMRNNQADIATLDHIVPRGMLKEYEINDPAFLVCACNACNSSKKHVSLEEWVMRKGFDIVRIIAEINTRIAMEII